MKFFSFRIQWISNQVASAEVIYMTLFPFSQAKVLSCLRQKLIKLCQRNMIFFTLHKAVKKPGFASFAFNVQNLSHSSRHNPGSGGQPVEFPSKGNSRSAVGEEDGIDSIWSWQGCHPYSKVRKHWLLQGQPLFYKQV